jgi:hypothetical protein
MSVPKMNYFFIPLLFIYVLFLVKRFWDTKFQFSNLVHFRKILISFFLVSGIFIFVFIFSADHPNLIVKDILQIIIIILLLLGFSLFVHDLDDYKKVTYYFNIQIISFSLIISLIGLLRLYYSFSEASVSFLSNENLFSTSLNSDKNFYCLSILIGILSIANLIFTVKLSSKNKILLQFALFILSLNVLFSGSRRGLISIAIFVAVNLVFNIYILFKPRLIRLNTIFYLLIQTLFFVVIVSFFSASNLFKLNTAQKIGVKIDKVNKGFYYFFARYATIFTSDQDKVRNFIYRNIESKYPFSGWGIRKHTEVYPLYGKDVNIVPEGSIGYKMDNTCDFNIWDGNAYSFTDIYKLFTGNYLVKNSNNCCASVFCYVSSDFNGTWVRISAEGDASGNILKEYDLTKRGTWQKLEITFSSSSKIPPVFLFWSKFGVNNFKTLTGYVIFSYPEYRILKLQTVTEDITTKFPKYPQYANASFLDIGIKKLIHNVFTKDINKNSKQSSASDSLFVDADNKFSAPRIERWKYGYYLFINKYSLRQKLFGGGFAYMKSFGEKFGESEYDYPHNPIIDSFLYSGIIGGGVYIYFIFLVFYNYIRYLKYHRYFFVCFLVVFFFSIVSANDHFSIPVFTFLSLVPFLTKYYADKTVKVISDHTFPENGIS